jgi:outer membrane protein assembly factor BamB
MNISYRYFFGLGLALLLVSAAPLWADESDWPQWRGPSRDNIWPERNPAATFPKEGWKPVWRQPIGGGYGGIAVVNGRVFVMDRQTEPKEVERVICVQFATGKQLWSHEYPVKYGGLDYGNGPRSTPTIHDGRVYTFGALGHLHCLDAASGKVIWSHDCVQEFKARTPTWGHACSPLIDGDRVLVQVGAAHGCLIAFDRKTGRENWRSIDDEPGYSSPVRIDVGKNKLVIMWTPENINACDAETGKRLWSVPHKVTYGVSIADPIWHDGILMVAEYWNGTVALSLDGDALNPEEAWSGKKLRLLMATPLVRGGHAYCLDREHGLMCIELKSGKIKWDEARIAHDRHNPHAALNWTGDGRLIALNEKGELIQARVSPEKYEELARTKLFAGSWAHPAFADGCIVVREEKAGAEILCVRLVEANK